MTNLMNFFFTLTKTNTILSRSLISQGLDFNDFMILSHLGTAPKQGLRRIDLAKKMGLTPSGITRMLLPLEKLHIIKRDLTGQDARARLASLTPAGRNLLRDASTRMELQIKDLLPINSNKEINSFVRLLEEIITRLD